MNDAGAAWLHAMRMADFPAAWRISDAVLTARDPGSRDDPSTPYHERWVWNGQPPDGQDVLVRCYHGLGDTIQFARFLPALRARAARLTVECQPSLVPLLAQITSIDRLLPFDVAQPRPPASCTMEIMELGHVLRPSASEVGAMVPYFAATTLIGFGGAVGVCWRAGGWDVGRSISLPGLLALVQDARLISLQRGSAARDARDDRFFNPEDEDMSVLRTAELIRSSARVMTVDTMVAHLTGALFHPGTVLLKADADWRWSAVHGRSVWYPSLELQTL